MKFESLINELDGWKGFAMGYNNFFRAFDVKHELDSSNEIRNYSFFWNNYKLCSGVFQIVYTWEIPPCEHQTKTPTSLKCYKCGHIAKEKSTDYQYLLVKMVESNELPSNWYGVGDGQGNNMKWYNQNEPGRVFDKKPKGILKETFVKDFKLQKILDFLEWNSDWIYGEEGLESLYAKDKIACRQECWKRIHYFMKLLYDTFSKVQDPNLKIWTMLNGQRIREDEGKNPGTMDYILKEIREYAQFSMNE